MMTITDPIIIYLLLISNAALLAAACIAIVRFQNQCHLLEKFWHSPTGTALADRKRDDAAQQAQTNLRVERHITELQHALETLTKREKWNQSPIERSLPIENAVRMAKNGASIEELARTCGLNIGEARLMKKMHGKVRAVTNGA